MTMNANQYTQLEQIYRRYIEVNLIDVDTSRAKA